MVLSETFLSSERCEKCYSLTMIYFFLFFIKFIFLYSLFQPNHFFWLKNVSNLYKLIRNMLKFVLDGTLGIKTTISSKLQFKNRQTFDGRKIKIFWLQ